MVNRRQIGGGEPVGDLPPVVVYPSAPARHQLDRFRGNTRVKLRNTMVVPGIQIEGDIDLINQGYAHRVGDSRYEINGRVYVIKPDGAAYLESGDGVIAVSRPVLLALRELIRHGGPPATFVTVTERDPTYTEGVIREALELFEAWKGET